MLNNAKAPVGNDRLKNQKGFFGALVIFYRCRLQILANLFGKHFGWNGSNEGQDILQTPTAREKVKVPWGPKVREEKGTPNLNFLVRISSAGVGVFHMKGVGAKQFGMSPRNPGNQTLLGGISRDFAGISRKCPKSLRKKCLGSILVSLWRLISNEGQDILQTPKAPRKSQSTLRAKGTLISEPRFSTPCEMWFFHHLAAKGVRQKELDEKSDRSVRKSDQKWPKESPKTKKKMIELLLPTSFCGTLFPTRERENRIFSKRNPRQRAVFPFSRGEKIASRRG